MAHLLLEQAQATGTPLIDGETVTFIWRGSSAPQLIGDFNEWGHGTAGAAQLQLVDADVWMYRTSLPNDAYIEYIYTTDPDDVDKRILDPFNRRQVDNGFGINNNSFSMPNRTANLTVEFMSNTAQGSVSRHAIYHHTLFSGERRDIWLYQPPTDKPAPLLVVFDGKGFLRSANITQIVANMLAVGRIRPVALALIDNAREHRYVEYNASDTVLTQITELVMPLAYTHLNLVNHEAHLGAWGVLGASLGGMMALYSGLRLPHIFGKVIMQAGDFQLDMTDHPPLLEYLVRTTPKRDIAIWQNVGTFDSLYDQNKRMYALLQERGYTVTFRDTNAGHNWTAWRDTLPAALAALFPA